MTPADPPPDALVGSYDHLAGEYVRRIYDELQHKPFDRDVLDRFARRVRGPACDLGCGPGQVARYLHERGADVCGIDLSPAMVEHARRLNPGIEFRVGDMGALDVPDGAWAGIAAFYSILHLPRAEVTAVLRELRRTLRRDGVLLLAFHLGDQVAHLDELWGYGFEVEEALERDPYPEVEAQTRRCYMLAT